MKTCRWLFLSLCVVVWVNCAPKVKYQYTEGKIYGTYYHISYASPTDLQTGIREQMEKVNQSLSMFNPESVIAKINRNITENTDTLFRRMFMTAEKVYRQTGGAFDITVAPLVDAWGFGVKKEEFPDSAKIDSLMQYVGLEKITLNEEKIVKKYPGIRMDASSIAKGLGVDLVADYLEGKGVSDYMVEIGGEVRVKGKSEKQRPWRIGIDRPQDDVTAQQQQLQAVLALTSGALATSGNYRNFYIREGKKYAHTINPKTGFPVQTEIVGSSVYTKSCMEADAYATAFMVMGLEKAQEVVRKNPDMEAFFIYQEKDELKTWISEGMEQMISGNIGK